MLNQASSERILVRPDENDRVGIRLEAQLAAPFDTLLRKAKTPARETNELLDSSAALLSPLV